MTTKKRKKLVLGKPMSHWQKMADELVMDVLVRGAHNLANSIPGNLARDRLLELARQENPEVLQKTLQSKAAWMGFTEKEQKLFKDIEDVKNHG